MEKKRQKREVEEEDFKNRVDRLMQRNKEIDEIRKANAKMLADMKLKIRQARSKVAEYEYLDFILVLYLSVLWNYELE